MKVNEKRLTRCCAEDWDGSTLRKLKIVDDRLVLDIKKGIVGAVLLPPTDGQSSGFLWDRVIIDAVLPEGSSMQVFAFASDIKDNEGMVLVSKALGDTSKSYRELMTTVNCIMGNPVADGGDFLANSKGRYLWLLIFLIQTGNDGPYIKSVTYRMEGDHMADYLPGIYSGDELTRRFLSVFNSIYTDMDLQIDNIPKMLNIKNSSEEMLRYLASWLEIDDSSIPLDVLRERMSTAARKYELMYTPEGVKWNIERLTGAKPLLLEYADVDPNAADCPDPELFRQFFGEDPYRFFVFLSNDVFQSRDRIEKFQNTMKRMIPAGMTMALITTGSVKDPGGQIEANNKKEVARLIKIVSSEDTVFGTEMIIGGEDLE